MGNRQNCAKFQENIFRSNEIILIFCPPLFCKRPITLSFFLPLFQIIGLRYILTVGKFARCSVSAFILIFSPTSNISASDKKGNRDNFEIIIHKFSIKTYFVTCHENRLDKTVLMRGHNICFL